MFMILRNDYYNQRNENFIVGVIDKSKRTYDEDDLFKVRTPLKKSEQKEVLEL